MGFAKRLLLDKDAIPTLSSGGESVSKKHVNNAVRVECRLLLRVSILIVCL